VETTTALGVFPFGSPVRLVEQTDRTPKKVFVLGVYASAVHARWLAPDGSVLIQALAVASEPSIFWKGDKAEEVIKGIHLPNGAGSLEPAEERFNGPSGEPWTGRSSNPWALLAVMPGWRIWCRTRV
jgi:hypothetical protein